jgi:[acyl-carrier-protein] S-malonyltransferase
VRGIVWEGAGSKVKLGFVFPGQGAQYVGMGKEFLERYGEAYETFREADARLGFSLSDIIQNGPDDQLRLTYHTQPALLTTSIAALRVFQRHSDVLPFVTAGHSLGEYSALVAAGHLDFSDAVELVYRRGRAMDVAVPAGQGAMSAVLGMDTSALGEICREVSENVGVVELANVNCPGQIVISGTADAVRVAGEAAKAEGARRVIPLDVSGPFHCSLMKPASQSLEQSLANTSISESSVAVIANVDGKPKRTDSEIRTALAEQLYKPVQWEQGVRTMLELGVDGFVEFGAGTVLSGLIRKIERRIPVFHVENESSLQETLQAIS